ncbi:MAG: LacI family DNA-binding transcriptional regulator [Bacteroidales bacterium]|nr:LacI family DNA-binding transcriptional regulator [Bacteroidales bacterium]
MKSKVTLTDIAQHLNVSVAVISLVLRNKWKENRISKELAKKVKEAAEQLGYKPNVLAQSLRTGKSGIIGLIIADISNPFYGKIAGVIENEAEKSGYEVMFGSSEENLNKFIKVGETLISRQVDGLIVVPVAGSDAILTDWKARNIPIISIDRFVPNLDIPYVVSDNYQGSLLVTDFMIKKGYRKIVFVTNDSDLSTYKERENGFLDAVKKSTVTNISHTVFKLNHKNWKIELRNLMPLILKMETEIIYFPQNMLGIEGIRIFKEMNINIPNDISVVCYDNSEIFELYKPGITCYEQPISEMATDATSLLIKKLTKNIAIDKYRKKILGNLIIRESC